MTVLKKRGNFDTHRRLLCEDESRYQNGASTSPRTSKIACKPPETGRGLGNSLSLLSKGTSLTDNLDLILLASRMV